MTRPTATPDPLCRERAIWLPALARNGLIPSGGEGNICSMTGPAPTRRSDTLPAGYPQFLAEIIRILRSTARAGGPRLMSVSIVVMGE